MSVSLTNRMPRSPRKALMLGAVIEANTLSAPVRIRNLSAEGSMIEGAVLPRSGEQAVLRRHDIAMGATVAWCGGGRCGLRFDDVVSVEDWVSGRRSGPGAVSGQARVDAIQRDLRAGGTAAEDASSRMALPEPCAAGADLDVRIAEELGYVSRLLDAADEDLSDQPVVVQRHMQSLQNLDLASQILGQLCEVLASDDRTAAVARVAMYDLRSRLTRQALFG